MKTIPFNWATPIGRELEYLAQAATSGHMAGDGEYTKKCESFLEHHTGARRALLTTSCTHALEMAALLLNIGPGDEVVVPSFTFVSTINAFVLRGARPIFVDIRPDTLNLDERQLPALISARTKAVVIVHYAGVGCEMDAIIAAAERMGVAVVEDNAHGLFGRYKGRPLGSFGTASALSFHETKNYTCGEGGALLLNNSEMIARAEILREKGTNRNRFFRGEIDKYTWIDLGSSYVPSELAAAFLFGQLELFETVQSRRRDVFTRYADGLAQWAEAQGVVLPYVPSDCDVAYHMFYVRLPDLDARQRFIAHLKERSVHSVFHYVPLHLAPMSSQWGYKKGDCSVTERVSDQLVRLPFYTTLTAADQQRAIDTVCSFRV
jgi:dTDP-4-amino-4,6-dideoxygalactose transaminase